MKLRVVYQFIAILLSLASCDQLIPEGPDEHEILDGPISGLNGEEIIQFIQGDIAFNDEIFTAETGLGPYFVATSCGTCHVGDGKGHPFTTLTRFGQGDTLGNPFLSNGGPQLQNRALPGFLPEHLPENVTFSRFTPPANTGLGFLEALTDTQILSNADPLDLDGDGISGVPNYIVPPPFFSAQAHHLEVNGKYIGRFGKKASAITLLHQTVNAYNQDMGITSDFSPGEPSIYNRAQQTADNVPDPEVSTHTINNLVFYLRTLKAPVPRNTDATEVIQGGILFSELKCADCHLPTWTTPVSDIQALSNTTFHPYTDLLLHDMGTSLDDGYTEGSALTAEWRTPPLWGIGLSKDAQGGQYFLMHDGRARSIQEAILLHGGEAESSKVTYMQLTDSEKQQLISFLESL